LVSSDIQDWNITFADTGVISNIGQRLKAVEKYLEGEDMFLANYSDGLTDLPLASYIEHFRAHDKIASCICITPPLSYHVISLRHDDHVDKIECMNRGTMKVNGGYFIFKKDIFRYIQPGEELVVEPFQRLIKENQLIGYRHDGYWYARGEAPWELWKNPQHRLEEQELECQRTTR
jgi:glucose-1-phosphate cytidylyltransferase